MTARKPLVSVVVPVYNASRFIAECVQSVIDQTLKEFELILVDDGSTDKSGAICDDFAENDARITVIHQQNGGQTSARKAGVAKARADYIMLIDADDWLAKNALEVLHATAIKEKAEIVTCDSYFHFKNYKIVAAQPLPAGSFDKQGLMKTVYPRMLYSGRFFYFGIYAAMWNKLFRADILKPNLAAVDNKVKVGEDGLTSYGAFLDAERVSIIHDRLYHYRNYNDSITRSYVSEQFKSAQLLIASLRELSKKKGVYDLTTQIDYYLMYNVRSIFEEEFLYITKRSLGQRLTYLKSVANDTEVRRVAQSLDTTGLNRWSRRCIELLAAGRFYRLIVATLSHLAFREGKAFVRRILKPHRS